MSHKPGEGPNATHMIHARIHLRDGSSFVGLLPGNSIEEAHEGLIALGVERPWSIEERIITPDPSSPIVTEIGEVHPGVKTSSRIHTINPSDTLAVTAP